MVEYRCNGLQREGKIKFQWNDSFIITFIESQSDNTASSLTHMKHNQVQRNSYHVT